MKVYQQRLLEALLFEDLCALYNLATDAETPESPSSPNTLHLTILMAAEVSIGCEWL
jgi:hypothetical protein